MLSRHKGLWSNKDAAGAAEGGPAGEAAAAGGVQGARDDNGWVMRCGQRIYLCAQDLCQQSTPS